MKKKKIFVECLFFFCLGLLDCGKKYDYDVIIKCKLMVCVIDIK